MFSKFRNWLRSSLRRSSAEDPLKGVARQLNHPILEPLQNSQPAFRSSRHFQPSDVAARIQRIAWFTNCGRPLSANLSMPIRRCSDWTQALALGSRPTWSTATLEAQNQLTVWLHSNAIQEYRHWNEVVGRFKATLLGPVVEPAIRGYSQQHGLSDRVLHSVTWNILGALMANHYLYTGHQAFFFLELLEIYEAGHFPCGWTGKWPKGKLHVF